MPPDQNRALFTGLLSNHHRLQRPSHPSSQFRWRYSFAIRPILEDIHQQFRIVAIRHFKFVGAVVEYPAFLFRMPFLRGQLICAEDDSIAPPSGLGNIYAVSNCRSPPFVAAIGRASPVRVGVQPAKVEASVGKNLVGLLAQRGFVVSDPNQSVEKTLN